VATKISNLYRGVHEFKKAYQPKSNLVIEENGDLFADSHNILNRMKNTSASYSVSTVLMVLMVLGRDMHTVEPFVPDPNSFEVEIAIEKLKT
jgi:hypothetical protein